MQNRAFLKVSPAKNIRFFFRKNGDEGYLSSYIITKDEDFAQWTLVDRPGPQIIWLRIGNCKNTELIDWLMPMWLQVIFALEQGERLIEID
jgi:predicted nuclease of predicted toxin-antitoxin system